MSTATLHDRPIERYFGRLCCAIEAIPSPVVVCLVSRHWPDIAIIRWTVTSHHKCCVGAPSIGIGKLCQVDACISRARYHPCIRRCPSCLYFVCCAIDNSGWAIVERLSAFIPIALSDACLRGARELETSPCTLVVAHAVNSQCPGRCIDLCRDVKRDGLSWVIGHFIAVRLYLRCGRLRVDDPCRCAGIL